MKKSCTIAVRFSDEHQLGIFLGEADRRGLEVAATGDVNFLTDSVLLVQGLSKAGIMTLLEEMKVEIIQ